MNIIDQIFLTPILAIANKTSNMGLVIIGMIVVILGLVGYTFLKNK